MGLAFRFEKRLALLGDIEQPHLLHWWRHDPNRDARFRVCQPPLLRAWILLQLEAILFVHEVSDQIVHGGSERRRNHVSGIYLHILHVIAHVSSESAKPPPLKIVRVARGWRLDVSRGFRFPGPTRIA